MGILSTTIKNAIKNQPGMQRTMDKAKSADTEAPKPNDPAGEQAVSPVGVPAVPEVPEGEAKQLLNVTNDPNASAGVPVKRTPERNFSLERISSEDDLNAMLNEVSAQNEGFKSQRRGKISDAENQDNAQALIDDGSMSDEKLLGFKPGVAGNAEQITAARQIMVTSANELKQMADLINQGQSGTQDMLEFRQAVAKHSAIQMHVQGLAAEAGRALRAFSLTAREGDLRLSEMDQVFGESGGDRVAKMLARQITDADSVADINDAAAKSWKATKSDALIEVWINGLLSGPKTHVANMTGNFMSDAMGKLVERPLAAAIGTARTAGNRAASKAMGREVGTQDQVLLGEVGVQLMGWTSAYMDGFRMMARSVKTGESVDFMQKIERADRKAFQATTFGAEDVPYLGKGLDLFGELYVRVPGRFLQAEDDLFKTVAFRGELNALAYRRAAKESPENIGQRMSEIMENPPDEMLKEAMEHARYQTFTDELGTMGKSIQQLSNSNNGMKMILPFVRTPANLVNYAVERSPLAPLSATFRKDFAAGGARRDLAMAKLSMGAAASFSIYSATTEGRITGAGPDDPKMRAALKETGWQPNSILIGDTYVSYNRLDPIGMMIGLNADAADMARYATSDKDKEGLLQSMILGTASNLTSKQYMRGLSDLFDVLNGRKSSTDWVGRQASSLSPSWLNTIAQAEDDVRRDGRSAKGGTIENAWQSVINGYKKRNPWTNQELPPYLDGFGEVRISDSIAAVDMLSPAWTSNAENIPIANELVKNGVGLGEPRPVLTVQGTPINLYDIPHKKGYGWALNDYRALVGKRRKEAMQKAINTSGYKRITEEQKGVDSIGTEVLTKALSRATAAAKMEYLGRLLKNPDVSESLKMQIESEMRNKTFAPFPMPLHLKQETPPPEGPNL